jgi:hypothetical protein
MAGGETACHADPAGKTRNSKPETRNQKPETRNQKLETLKLPKPQRI